MDLLQFQMATELNPETAARWFSYVNEAMEEFGITSVQDQSMFIAMVGHESESFSRLVESLDYKPSALQKTFHRRISWDQARILGTTPGHPAQQEAIANLVYGGEWGKANLGNESYGNGWKYRGRGLLRLTGLAHYRACGEALALDLETFPELLEQDALAARSAAWLFSHKACTGHEGDVELVTLILCGSPRGVEDRRRRFQRALSVLT
ncbi:glycoside hydrolase family 19 protein [Entomohabitans teleogrylli]|uniref:glycoside hydrolase family 19 protein n=1 Tax=Entomohabitans teleogrylli TaxID=1384589 RepID=UPI00073D7941|nr:glycoside hydrolase family 19 protein [Entomohabitans teleogrylli]